MAVIGTFGSFTAARLGIYASQASLNVTGNNIANINTDGYTRQRLDLVSLGSTGDSRYVNKFSLNIGYGVLANGTSQLRDPFLDIRYRDENASVGAYEARVKGLQQISAVFDEVGLGDDFGIIEAQFNDFLKQLQGLNNRVNDDTYDTLVRSSAESLVTLFNNYSEALTKVQDNQLKDLQEDVGTVNTILEQIRDMNAQIRNAGIYGDNALELRDERNVLIDQLSAYMKIDVRYDMEKLDEFSSVERLNISIANSGNPPIKLIEGIFGAQISMPEMIESRNPDYNPDLPTSNRYIAHTSTPEKIVYTNLEREAMRVDGEIVTNDADGLNLLNGIDDFGDIEFAEEDMYGYPATPPQGGKYISKESDPTSTPPDIKYTNDVKQALEYEDAKGNKTPVTNNAAGAELIKQITGYETVDLDEANMYDKNVNTFGQYLDEDGYPTDDITQAAMINNAVEKVDNNRLWMRVEPLVDQKGRYIKDEYGQEVKEIVELGDNQLYGSLQTKRELLTEEGEFASTDDLKFDPNANIKRGIPYYQRALDALARKFADEFNKANTGTDEKGEPNYGRVFVGYETVKGADGIERYDLDPAKCDLAKNFDIDGTSQEALVARHLMEKAGLSEKDARDYLLRTDLSDLPEDMQTEVKALQATHLSKRGCGTEKLSGGILFSTSGDTDDYKNITAANISIANSWATGNVRILSSKNYNPLENTTADDNIYHMIELMSEKLGYKPNDISDLVPDAAKGDKTYFEGSFQQRLADINNILASDQKTATTEYNSFEIRVLSLENQRQSVSGVDLNDEATNMMMFQKSYSAACQLMTTLDSMLDKLINGTIR